MSSRAAEAEVRGSDAAAWTIVVPVKSLTGAKTRLAPELSPAERAALARAFALDTIETAAAAERVSRVVVVTDEPVIERALRETSGVEVVPEVGARGLSAAIAHGIAVARARPAPGTRAETEVSSGAGGTVPARDGRVADGAAGRMRPVAVLLGDLPSLRPGDLDAALELAARHPLAFVPDAEGTGTTLAAAGAGVPFVPHFGADSAALHAAAGFADLVATHPGAIAAGLRRDVDTAAELREAVDLGLGPRTASVVRTLTDLAAAPAPRHPFEPSATSAGADRKAAS